jgi:hypothetical protein
VADLRPDAHHRRPLPAILFLFLIYREIEHGPGAPESAVWLLAGGGTLYFAFPALYAASFNGFYLPCRPGMAID